jgi:hypothetical protein
MISISQAKIEIPPANHLQIFATVRLPPLFTAPRKSLIENKSLTTTALNLESIDYGSFESG